MERRYASFVIESVSTNTSPFAPSNILWGAAATALLGATLADWQRKREEEARVRAMSRRERLAAEGAFEEDEKGDGNTYGRIAKAYQASLNAFRASLVSKGLSPTEANAYKTQAIVNGSISSVAGAAQDSVDNAKTNQRMENQMAKLDAIDEAKWTASQAVIAQREQDKAVELAGLQAYYEGRKEGETQQEKQNVAAKVLAIPVLDDDPPTWWEKVTKAVGQAWDVTKEAVTSAWDVTKTVVTSAFYMTKKVAADLGNLLVETGKSLSNSFTHTVLPALQSAATGVQNTLTSIWDGTKKAVSDLAGNIKDLGNELVTSFKEMPKQIATGIDTVLDFVYDYHGPVNPPTGVTGLLQSALPGVSSSSPSSYIFDQYRVDQMYLTWPSANECVTAATIQDMNMMQDILAAKFGIPQLQRMDLPIFTDAFDAQPLWLIRPPADVKVVGGMLLPQSAELVLKGHSAWLRENFGCGYDVELTSGNTVDDLIVNLQNGYPTSLHIAYPIDLFKPPGGDYRALLGGTPHAVTLAGYDANTDIWQILDPGNTKGQYTGGPYTEWKTPELMDLWGRQFVASPPRFAMTTLIPDTTCTLPLSTVTPSGTPTLTQSATTGTPTPSQTPQARTGTSTP